MANNIFTIIVSYNSEKYIYGCLSSLTKAGLDKKKMIIIDNDSEDKTKQIIKNKFKDCLLLENKTNLGFSKAVNMGIKKVFANADYLMLINPDTKAKSDFLKPLEDLFKLDRDVGIVSPIISFKKDGGLVYDWGAKTTFFGKTIHENRIQKAKEMQEKQLVSGCCMMIKKEIFKKIGLFDESFFMYFEDSDFCLRARKAGFKIVLQPKAEVFHFGSSSFLNSREKMNNLIKSNYNFINKHVFWYFRPAGYIYLAYLYFKK